MLAFLSTTSLSKNMPIMSTNKNHGSTASENHLEICPTIMGTNMEPMYALAICKPIAAWDIRKPNLLGVSWIIHGKKGAPPNPINTNPTKENTTGKGSSKTTTPVKLRAQPVRMSCFFESLAVITPDKNLPTVIPP